MQPIHDVKERRAVAVTGAPKHVSSRSGTAKRTARVARGSGMVEVNGIEPMTSCLQSRRSPD